MGRAPCCDKANVKKGPWSPEEDATLKAYIEEHGTGGNWIALPRKIGLKRCGKSCRLRWLNYLRPNIKHGGFSEEEDRIICSLYVSIGSRWSIIAAQLPGRTDNDIKNYWNTRLKKKILGRQRDPASRTQLHRLSGDQELKDEGFNPSLNGSSQTLTASALERLQLHMQLHGLHNPFSYYNNTAISWPKLYPIGNDHKPLQTLNADGIVTAGSPLKHAKLAMAPIQATNMSNTSLTESIQEHLGVPSPSCCNVEAELHDLLYGCKGNQVTELDEGFKLEMNQEGIGWWERNGFDEKSSSSSWNSAWTLQPDTVLQ